MSDASFFLVRKERKALHRRLEKGETVLEWMQARHQQQVGLLAATSRRLVFVHKKAFRHGMLSVPKGQVQDMRLVKGRLATIHVQSRERALEFHEVSRGAAKRFMDVVAPPPPKKTGRSMQVRQGGPMEFKPARPAKPVGKPHPRQQGSHDPLTASKQQKLARLERLKQKGTITDAEYRWQKDALERS